MSTSAPAPARRPHSPPPLRVRRVAGYVDPDAYARLCDRASHECRSLEQQVSWILRQALAEAATTTGEAR